MHRALTMHFYFHFSSHPSTPHTTPQNDRQKITVQHKNSQDAQRALPNVSPLHPRPLSTDPVSLTPLWCHLQLAILPGLQSGQIGEEKRASESSGIRACEGTTESPPPVGPGLVPIHTAGVSSGSCLGAGAWAPAQCGAGGPTFRTETSLRHKSSHGALDVAHSTRLTVDRSVSDTSTLTPIDPLHWRYFHPSSERRPNWESEVRARIWDRARGLLWFPERPDNIWDSAVCWEDY